MRTLTLLLAFLCGFAVSHCSRSPTSIESPVSGTWNLHRGKAIDKLDLNETNGIINGTVTLDKDWGGNTHEVRGLRVGSEIELYYTRSTIDASSPSVTFLLKGKCRAKTMSGICILHIPTPDGTKTDETLWIAARESSSH